MSETDAWNYRREYDGQLNRSDLPENPWELFSCWFKMANEMKLTDPNAFFLSTCGRSVRPRGRIVLMREFDDNGLVFYTNYDSQKGDDIKFNPMVSAVFFWREIDKQVRFEGRAEKIDEESSLKYFHSRPRESQIAACASAQSSEILSRSELNDNVIELEKIYKGIEVPKPDNWGGYRIYPDVIEFWQGRENRLHDRFQYALADQNQWEIHRLAP